MRHNIIYERQKIGGIKISIYKYKNLFFFVPFQCAFQVDKWRSVTKVDYFSNLFSKVTCTCIHWKFRENKTRCCTLRRAKNIPNEPFQSKLVKGYTVRVNMQKQYTKYLSVPSSRSWEICHVDKRWTWNGETRYKSSRKSNTSIPNILAFPLVEAEKSVTN